jgi:hypothetical protein
MTISTAHRAAIAGLTIATGLTLGMTASTWNPYTRAVDAQVMPQESIDPPHAEGPILLSGYWEWVNTPLADSLAEGGAPDATTRDWEACKVHYDYAWTWVVCPDGYEENWRNW